MSGSCYTAHTGSVKRCDSAARLGAQRRGTRSLSGRAPSRAMHMPFAAMWSSGGSGREHVHVQLVMQYAVADDLAAVVYPAGVKQYPSRAGRYQAVQVPHDPIFPQERTAHRARSLALRMLDLAHNSAVIVHRRGYSGEEAWQHTQIDWNAVPPREQDAQSLTYLTGVAVAGGFSPTLPTTSPLPFIAKASELMPPRSLSRCMRPLCPGRRASPLPRIALRAAHCATSSGTRPSYRGGAPGRLFRAIRCRSTRLGAISGTYCGKIHVNRADHSGVCC